MRYELYVWNRGCAACGVNKGWRFSSGLSQTIPDMTWINKIRGYFRERGIATALVMKP